MNAVLTVARRELGNYLNSWWGWVVLALVLLFDGLAFNVWAVGFSPKYSAEVLESFFEASTVTVLIAGVLLAMPTIARETSSGTMTLLQTSPITEAQVIAGKYLGALGFLSLIKGLTLYMPLMIELNGKVSWGHIGAGYLGLFALGAATIAIGIYASSVSRYQMLAAILGGSLVGLFLLMWLVSRGAEPPLKDVFGYMAMYDRHFQPFMRGRINTESLVYYASVSFGFLLLATRSLKARRWM
ncbi:MAG: ABC transporter permease subunit [Alphaproteobacteria bacterium]|nr:ABC transporter permease subunit [Alphaproteobacteria bacterium]